MSRPAITAHIRAYLAAHAPAGVEAITDGILAVALDRNETRCQLRERVRMCLNVMTRTRRRREDGTWYDIQPRAVLVDQNPATFRLTEAATRPSRPPLTAEQRKAARKAWQRDYDAKRRPPTGNKPGPKPRPKDAKPALKKYASEAERAEATRKRKRDAYAAAVAAGKPGKPGRAPVQAPRPKVQPSVFRVATRQEVDRAAAGARDVACAPVQERPRSSLDWDGKVERLADGEVSPRNRLRFRYNARRAA